MQWGNWDMRRYLRSSECGCDWAAFMGIEILLAPENLHNPS